MLALFKIKFLQGTSLIKSAFVTTSVALAALAAAPAAQAASALTVATGSDFSCAVTTTGGAQCWGSNATGQVGSNTTNTQQLTPVNVFGLTAGVASISAGYQFACALMTDGTVKCWGRGINGQLGNNIAQNSIKPVNVSNLTGITAISTGYNHACALNSLGEVRCWGNGIGGGLGDGLGKDSAVPVLVQGVNNAVSIAAGSSFACAVEASGTVKCWGMGNRGQLGDGRAVNSPTRVLVSGISNAVSVTAGAVHACARSASGAVSCWGANNVGQVGNSGGTADVPTPVATSLSSGVTAITAGGFGNHTCALINNGNTMCWGQNDSRQLSTGDAINKTAPTLALNLSGVPVKLSAGTAHSCAVIGQRIQCWGANTAAQLGSGNTAIFTFPVNVITFDGNAPVSAPSAISPVTSNTPLYTWKAVAGATSYRLDVNGTVSTYTAAALGCDGGVGLCSVISAPLATGSYNWRVQGFNSFGDGPWSGFTNFRL